MLVSMCKSRRAGLGGVHVCAPVGEWCGVGVGQDGQPPCGVWLVCTMCWDSGRQLALSPHSGSCYNACAGAAGRVVRVWLLPHTHMCVCAYVCVHIRTYCVHACL